MKPRISAALLAIIAFNTAVLAQDIQPDGELILKDFSRPSGLPMPDPPDTVGAFGEGKTFLSDTPAGNHKTSNVIYQRRLAQWTDPLTLPHTRSVCVKWASGRWPWGGGWKTCVGWKTQFQFMQVSADLRVAVTYPDITLDAIRQASNTCLATGAVAAAAAAITTGGAGAAETFSGTLVACLNVYFIGGAVAVDVPTSAGWGEWT